jgi:hypothetical protein
MQIFCKLRRERREVVEYENRNTKDISLPSKIFHAFDLEVDQQ